MRNPMPRQTCRRAVRNSSGSGCSAICSCFSSSTKVGDSLRRRRMYTANAMRKTEARKGTRHSQPKSTSSGTRPSTAHTAAASNVPAWMPTNGRAEKKPRFGGGEYSAMSTVAPACSAPAPNPCSRRRHDQEDGRPDTDCRRRRQQADECGGQAHDRDGHGEDPFTTELVSHGAEEQAAEGSRQESDRVGREAEDQGLIDAECREEQLPEDQRRCGAIEREVVVLQRAPH